MSVELLLPLSSYYLGLRVTYNMSEPVGSRVAEVYARCADCRVPKYQPLEDEKVYEVVMNTYMAKGGDGFEVIQKHAIRNRNTGKRLLCFSF